MITHKHLQLNFPSVPSLKRVCAAAASGKVTEAAALPGLRPPKAGLKELQ